MKQVYEFDYATQDPEVSQSQLETAIATYVQEQGLTSLKVHQKRSSKAKKLIEGFITWDTNELTQQQLDDIQTILSSQFGLVGYTPPFPEEQVITKAEGLVCPNVTLAVIDTPYDFSNTQRGFIECAWPNSYGVLSQLWWFWKTAQGFQSRAYPSTGGVNPDPSYYSHMGLTLQNTIEGGADMVIPPGDMVVTLNGGASLTINNQAPLVVPPPTVEGTNCSFGWWIASDGRLYPRYKSINSQTVYQYDWYQAIELPSA